MSASVEPTGPKYLLDVEFSNGDFKLSNMNGDTYQKGKQWFVGSGTFMTGSIAGDVGSQFTIRIDPTDGEQADVNLYDLLIRGDGRETKNPVPLPDFSHHPVLQSGTTGSYYQIDLSNQNGPIFKGKLILLNP